MAEAILIIAGGLVLCFAAYREGYNIGWNRGWDDCEKWFRRGL